VSGEGKRQTPVQGGAGVILGKREEGIIMGDQEKKKPTGRGAATNNPTLRKMSTKKTYTHIAHVITPAEAGQAEKKFGGEKNRGAAKGGNPQRVRGRGKKPTKK